MPVEMLANAERREPAAPFDMGKAETSSWLLCRTGMHLCALPVEHVIEIMRTQPIEPVAGAPPYVRGLCTMRGAPVPVVDIGLLHGAEPTRAGRFVAIRTGSRTTAFAVEAVDGLRAFRPEAFKLLPPLLQGAPTAAIAAIGILDAELLFFLHAARMVPDDLPADVLARLDGEKVAR
jgi:purine-binding chemotaxis protein CheW